MSLLLHVRLTGIKTFLINQSRPPTSAVGWGRVRQTAEGDAQWATPSANQSLGLQGCSAGHWYFWLRGDHADTGDYEEVH